MLLFWVFFTLFSVVTSEYNVPISQVYANTQPPKGMADDEVIEENHGNSKKIIIISLIAASAVLTVVLLLLCCLWVIRMKRLKKSTKDMQLQLDVSKRRSLVPVLSKLNSLRMGGKKGNVPVLEYNLLVEATNSFEESSKIGEGGLGRVYKACLGENVLAAVKIVNVGADKEFQNEIGWLSKIQHQNIVSLIGSSVHEDTKFLVYEMLQNGSLESHLHGATRGSTLNWSLRMKIALDIARGLEYLHERCDPAVIHRNIKSSNILLDSTFSAKLSGFSLAVTAAMQNKNDLKITESLGYLAPEYLLDGKLTDKSDVYAFGVVLLELLTGRKPVEKLSPTHQLSVVTWAMPQFTDRTKLPDILDPVIRDKMDPKHLYQVAAVAVLCVQPEPSYRPLITDVLHSLIPLVPVDLGGSLRIA
ncbi:putative receptor-like protein kinase At1g80640 [Silene latifolia]|uniref:putative receptor-like protein kinase At1g80640 n=1 Tax=Silene latifolia TaxID=37657 RepID=UPI003D77DB29